MSDKEQPEFYKRNESDRIWWKRSEMVGEWLFSFDRVKVYNMFRDYPHAMTAEEVAIFDRENPYWASFFRVRNRKR